MCRTGNDEKYIAGESFSLHPAEKKRVHPKENMKKTAFQGNGGVQANVEYYETRFLFDSGGDNSFRNGPFN